MSIISVIPLTSQVEEKTFLTKLTNCLKDKADKTSRQATQ